MSNGIDLETGARVQEKRRDESVKWTRVGERSRREATVVFGSRGERLIDVFFCLLDSKTMMNQYVRSIWRFLFDLFTRIGLSWDIFFLGVLLGVVIMKIKYYFDRNTSSTTATMPRSITKFVIDSIIASKLCLVAETNTQKLKAEIATLEKKHSIMVDVIDIRKYTSNYGGGGDTMIKNAIFTLSGRNSLPLVYYRGDCLGIFQEMTEDNWTTLANDYSIEREYEVVVVGGGPSGIAMTLELAKAGKRVAIVDFCEKSPRGTVWEGLGGTGLNAGGRPKKIMHFGTNLSDLIKCAKLLGMQPQGEPKSIIKWTNLKDMVRKYIQNVGDDLEVQLKNCNATRIRGRGRFRTKNELSILLKSGEEQVLSSNRFVIAVGMRPSPSAFPGSEYCITSDDFFSLNRDPGKTLIIGGSFVALECAGIVRGLDFEVTILFRSAILKDFDQEMVSRIKSHMARNGVRFVKGAPIKITRSSNTEEYDAAWDMDGVQTVERFNTVLSAIGRRPNTSELGLPNVGIDCIEGYDKIQTLANGQCVGCSNVYCIGDVRFGGNERSSVATKDGKALASLLLSGCAKTLQHTFPTVLLTPIEYAFYGDTEEKAIEMYGKDALEVYEGKPNCIEYAALEKPDREQFYAKVICRISDDKKIVLGIHYLGPYAGEIIHGFAVAVKMSATLEDFEALVGAHPTVSEVFTCLTLRKEKETGETGILEHT